MTLGLEHHSHVGHWTSFPSPWVETDNDVSPSPISHCTLQGLDCMDTLTWQEFGHLWSLVLIVGQVGFGVHFPWETERAFQFIAPWLLSYLVAIRRGHLFGIDLLPLILEHLLVTKSLWCVSVKSDLVLPLIELGG